MIWDTDISDTIKTVLCYHIIKQSTYLKQQKSGHHQRTKLYCNAIHQIILSLQLIKFPKPILFDFGNV